MSWMTGELIVLYFIPMVISGIGALVTIWGTEELTVGDILSFMFIVFAPAMNLIAAMLFFKLLVEELIIPMLGPLWDFRVWMKKK